MNRPVILFSSVLLVSAATAGRAQTGDPFQRSQPTQSAPALKPLSAPANTTPLAAAAVSASTAKLAAGPTSSPSPITLTGAQNASFGNPRSSNDGSTTRVVFDLMPGVSYVLTPGFTGLTLEVRNARVIPSVGNRLGSSVTGYRAGGGQITLNTPYPLSVESGWKASEATIASGGRVLILEFAPTLTGGLSAGVRAGSLNPAVRRPPATAVGPAQSAATALTTAQTTAQSLPPGDTLASGVSVPPPLALPSAPDVSVRSPASGRIPGTPQPGAVLSAPRLGKNPGQTRVVLDLPPGTGYRILPGGLNLRVELTGVSTSGLEAQNISPELRSWRYEASGNGVTATFVTGAPVTNRSGWHAQVLPPLLGDRSRLVLDLSPGYADLTPLSTREKVIAAVPPIPATRGTAILALSASYVQPRVVIDPGHGGSDPGAVGSVIEKEVTLAVGLRVRDLLRAAGVNAVLTRDTDRELHPVKNTDLVMRAQTGTPGTQMFVSIHVNAVEPVNAVRGYGIETWWNPNHPLSSNLAQALQDNMVELTGAVSKGLKNSRSLAVLRNSRIPAALVEIGYTSHPVEGGNLKDQNYLDRVAVGIARGIRQALVSGITADAGAAGTAVGGAGK